MSITQNTFDFGKDQLKTNAKTKISEKIQCFECKHTAELDGYRFRLVPLCCCCRTEREVEITKNRFERRNKR